MIRMSGALARSRSFANCDLSRASSIRMPHNIPHYYRNIDFAVSAVNGAPSMRGVPGRKDNFDW